MTTATLTESDLETVTASLHERGYGGDRRPAAVR